jgi:radical SAM superfamily enzyme YgiQ (UPF0313 family)
MPKKFLLLTALHKQTVNVWVCQETSPAGSLLPPVDLASIAASIKELGHQAEILDLRLIHKEPIRKYLEVIEDFKPDALVLNLSTVSANNDYKLVHAAPDGIIKVCFGTHAQSLPDECFRNGFDYILFGDPEAAISSLLENNMDGRTAQGVLTPENRDRQPFYREDLDTLPFPALENLDLRKYHAPYIKRNNLFTLLLGSRGCVYSCTYCLYPVQFGNTFRTRSIHNILDEIERDYKKFGIQDFYFLDATFNINQKRVEDFCEGLFSRGLNINWMCNMRVSPVSDEMLRHMKKSGCVWIFYGVEDQDFLDETRKRISKESTIEAFRKTREAGISTIAFTMLFPRQEISEKTYSKNILSILHTLHADAFQCNVAIPFPGTEIYKKYDEKGNIGKNWDTFDPHGDVLPYKSEIDLIKVKRNVYRGFLLSHPLRVMRTAVRMNIRSLIAVFGMFVKKNLLSHNVSKKKM